MAPRHDYQPPARGRWWRPGLETPALRLLVSLHDKVSALLAATQQVLTNQLQMRDEMSELRGQFNQAEIDLAQAINDAVTRVGALPDTEDQLTADDLTAVKGAIANIRQLAVHAPSIPISDDPEGDAGSSAPDPAQGNESGESPAEGSGEGGVPTGDGEPVPDSEGTPIDSVNGEAPAPNQNDSEDGFPRA